MSFEVKRVEENGKLHFYFCGQIDEEVSFLEVDNMPSEVVVDLSEVTSINSVGIRAWILWFSQFPETTFQFKKCPKALVMQMNMVEGFLPAKSEVLSLEVPFFCEECDTEKDVLFYVGKEILVENNQVKLSYDKKSICKEGCDPELDANETKFFRFLLQKFAEKAA